MDTLSDLLNSRKLYVDKPARCALTVQGQSMTHLEELDSWIKKWKLCGVRSQPSIASHWGLSVTTNSILTLSRELLSDGFKLICNQDCIENFFAIIRSKGGWNDIPTVRQFRASYRNTLFLLSVEKGKSNSNFLQETDFLTAFSVKDFIEMGSHNQMSKEHTVFAEADKRTKHSHIQTPVPFCSEETVSQPIEQVLTYMAEWLIRRVRLCDQCEHTLCRSSTDNPTANEQFIDAKKYDISSILLTPNAAFVFLVCDMEVISMSLIKDYLEIKGVAMNLINKIKEGCQFDFLYSGRAEHAIHLEHSTVKLFVVTRIFYLIKFYNRDLCHRNKENAKKTACVLHK